MDSDNKPKYCVNCADSFLPALSPFAVVQVTPKRRCKSENQGFDLVTGELKSTLCELQRSVTYLSGYCGEAGLWYQQRDGGS